MPSLTGSSPANPQHQCGNNQRQAEEEQTSGANSKHRVRPARDYCEKALAEGECSPAAPMLSHPILISVVDRDSRDDDRGEGEKQRYSRVVRVATSLQRIVSWTGLERPLDMIAWGLVPTADRATEPK